MYKSSAKYILTVAVSGFALMLVFLLFITEINRKNYAESFRQKELTAASVFAQRELERAGKQLQNAISNNRAKFEAVQKEADLNLNGFEYKDDKIKSNDSQIEIWYNKINNIKNRQSADIVLYRRVNKKGDMAIVSATMPVSQENTFLYARENDFKPNILISTILLGQTFYKLNFIDNTPYLTAYKRLADNKGSVCGMTACYIDISSYFEYKDEFSENLPKIFLIDSISANALLVSEKASSIQRIRSLRENLDSFFASAANWDRMTKLNAGKLIQREDTNAAVLVSYSEKTKTYIAVIIPNLVADTMSGAFRNMLPQIALIVLFFAFITILLIYKKIQSLDTNSDNEPDNKYISKVNYILELLIHKKLQETKAALSEIRIGRDIINAETVEFDNTIKQLESVCELIEHSISKNNENALRFRNVLRSTSLSASETSSFLLSQKVMVKEALNQLKKSGEETAKFILDTTDLEAKYLSIQNYILRESSVTADLESLQNNMNKNIENAGIKLGSVKDKAAKFSSETNTLKKLSDRAYILSINTSITAEKNKDGKGDFIAGEIKKISEKLLNIAEAYEYMHTEMQISLHYFEHDFDSLRSIIDRFKDDTIIADKFTNIIEEHKKFTLELDKVKHALTGISSGFPKITELLEETQANNMKIDKQISELSNIDELNYNKNKD